VLLVRHTPEELEAMVGIAVELIDGAAEAVQFAKQRRQLWKVRHRTFRMAKHIAWAITSARTMSAMICLTAAVCAALRLKLPCSDDAFACYSTLVAN
jgi:hypothetical protein